MLKKMYMRKFYVSILAIFAMFLIYLIPSSNPKLEVKEELEYVGSDVVEADVFLMDKDSYVALTEVPVSEKDVVKRALELIKILTVGGMDSKVPSGFSGILPPDTEVLSASFEDGILKLDFSKEILDISKELEEKMIEAIVYTMTSIEKVDKVIIYVEGDILTKLPKTKIILPGTLDRSFGINKEFNLTSTKDIMDVTVYYINQINDSYYYIPVTKYLNGDNDKVSVMVEELSNNSRLKSFLPSYTSAVSSIIEGNVIKIELSNKEDNKFMKEKIDKTVLLSACDNFDVDEVILNGDSTKCRK